MSTFEATQGGGRAPAAAAPRLPALDALRGLMALAVAVYHLSTWTHIVKLGTRANTTVALLGLYSVQGFFVISGFCFFYLYRDVRFDLAQSRAFFIRRFFRIAPLYYAVLALNLLLGQAIEPVTVRRLIENVTLTFGLFHPNHSLLLGGWSIGIEYVFYLAFPLLIRLLRVRGALYPIALLSCLLAWQVTQQIQALPELQKFNGYARVPNHACLFLLGGVAADLRARTRLRLSARSVGLGLCALLTAALCAQPTVYDHFELVTGAARVGGVLLCVLGVLLCAMRGEHEQRSTLGATLGDLSYAVYLLHPLAWLLTTRLLSAARQPHAAFALALVLTLCLAALAHRALERPLLQLGRRLAERETPRRRQPAAAPGRV
jgi:peptidoglycan/LPS O-acetylase OafA/YrhL